MELIAKHIDEISDVATQIFEKHPDLKVILLTGNLGAGKTTLVKSMVSILGALDEASSPTFSIINEYSSDDKSFFHIDLYRLESLEEALEIGIEEYLYSGNYCFIEWPQIIESILPERVLHIKIESLGANSRKFILNLV